INYKRCTTDNVKNGTGATGDGCGVVTVDTTQGSGTTQDNSTDGGSKTPQHNNAYSGICCLQGKEVAISSSLCRANNGKDGSCENLTQGSYCSSTSQCKTGLVCGDKKCVTSAQAFTCGSDADCTSDKYCDWTGTRTCKTLLVANQCNPQNPGNRCEAYNLVCHSSGDCIDPNSQAVNDPNLGKRGFLCNLDGSCNDSDNDYCEREMFVCREKPTAKNGQPANTVQGQVLVDSYSQPIVQYTGQNNIPVNQQSNSSGALQDTTVNQSTETPLQRTVEIIKTDINESILETLIARLPQNDDIIEQASNSGQSVATVISNLTEVRTNMCANLSNCKISQSKTLTQMNGFYYACKGLNEADQFVSNLATSLNCDQDLGRFKIASAELLQQYEQDTGEVLAKPTTNYTPRVETRTCERSCYENSSDINQCIADCNASTEVPAKQTKFNNELEQVNTQSNLWSQVAKKPLADTDGSEVLCLGDNTTDICLNQTVNLVVYRGTDNTFGQCEQQNLNQRTGEWSCSFRENAIPCPYPPADLITTNPEEYQIATSCVLNGNSTQAAVDGNICAYDFDKGYCVTTSNVYEEAVEYQNNSAR
ncbi:hypothetical protein KC678_01695, partial [Candidatus Dojkabacteria bacterium]|nr:hypothetical protein [Candidatus Dojkabacteria bacterium]